MSRFAACNECAYGRLGAAFRLSLILNCTQLAKPHGDTPGPSLAFPRARQPLLFSLPHLSSSFSSPFIPGKTWSEAREWSETISGGERSREEKFTDILIGRWAPTSAKSFVHIGSYRWPNVSLKFPRKYFPVRIIRHMRYLEIKKSRFLVQNSESYYQRWERILFYYKVSDFQR